MHMTNHTNCAEIIAVTRWTMANHGKTPAAATPGESRTTVYGVDQSGTEYVYAAFDTEEEFTRWCDTDPLWRAAQRRLIERLLDNPATRDAVLQLNVAAGLERGDAETAYELFRRLSPERQRRLLDPEDC